MLNICIIVQNYYKIDPRVRRTAELLVNTGYSVDVFCLRNEDENKKNYHLNGVNVFTAPLSKKRASNLRYIFEYLAFFLLTVLFLTRQTQKKRYELIHVNTLPDFLVYAGLVHKIFGTTIILDMHEVMPEFYMSKFGVPMNHILIKLIKWQERVSIRFADQVITINEPIKILLENRNTIKNKITVVMNSVDNSLFSLPESRINNNSDNKFIFMYHGTLTRLYGLDIAIRAFSKAAHQMPNANFWMLGEGSERSNLEQLSKDLDINEKVKFLGVHPQQDMVEWLSRCDVGVLPTRQDVFSDLSFSNKLPEYIVMKKPVIVSRLKTIRYYFSDEALAFFEPHNEEDLAQQMIHIYNIPELRQSLVSKALIEYQSINWKVMQQRYLSLIDRITA